MTLKSPYPWFGGKSRVAEVVWRAFGNVPNYVEPFFGSGAVLLGRPHPPKTETINDLDCYVANFWRAIQKDPIEVAKFADWPVCEVDLDARHLWLVNQVEIRERMMTDPEFFDIKVAGWWVWGICSWIGSGWCVTRQPAASALGDAGQGVHRKLPHLGDAGQGVHRKLPHLGDAGRLASLVGYFENLADRFRGVRICCGDWTRVMGDSVTWRHGTTGIFLDPPYDDGAIDYSAGGRGLSESVAGWCREHGDDVRLRIAVCGFDGDYDLPGWQVHKWKAHGGFSGQLKDGVNENPRRERIWLSRHCNRVDQPDLFSRLVAE